MASTSARRYGLRSAPMSTTSTSRPRIRVDLHHNVHVTALHVKVFGDGRAEHVEALDAEIAAQGRDLSTFGLHERMQRHTIILCCGATVDRQWFGATTNDSGRRSTLQ